MNYGRLLAHSWQLTRRQRILWLYGFVISLGALGNYILRPYFIDQTAAFLHDPSMIQSEGIEMERVVTVLVIWTGIIFFISIAYWLMAAIAQGAIIGAVFEMEKGSQVSVRQALKFGAGLLGRFIAIDTLVYFPMFVLLLILLLAILVLLLGVLFLLFRAVSEAWIGSFLIFGLAGISPLFLLLIPLGLLSTLFRSLAFRDTAVRHSNVGGTIRNTWNVIRRQVASLLIFWGLMWGIQILTNTLLTFVMLPLFWILKGSVEVQHWEGWLAGLVAVGPLTVLHTFTAVAWTVAYQKWVE